MDLESIDKQSSWGTEAAKLNSNFTKMATELTKVSAATTKLCGYFANLYSLQEACPAPTAGMTAYVGGTAPYAVYACNTDRRSLRAFPFRKW